MKLLLYIGAIVALVGAVIFSWLNIEKHETQLNQTKATFAEVNIMKRQVAAKTEALQQQVELKELAKEQNFALIADKDIKENDLKRNTKISDNIDNELKILIANKEKNQKELAEFKNLLDKENIPFDKAEELITNLNSKKNELSTKNIALKEESEIFSDAVKRNQVILTDYKEAQLKRRKNLNANGVSSLITAVDNEWGFVVVKPHSDALIKPESKLLVIRGNKHIGRLTINAIETEAGRVLANIVYSSIAPGMRIRAGDRVILSNPLTQ